MPKFFLLQQDKQLHFLAGALAACFFAGLTRGSVLWIGLGPLGVGILKECWDWLQNWNAQRMGHPAQHSIEALDAISTALPGWILAAIIYFWKA